MSISISGNGTFTGANSDYSFDQSVGIAGTLTYEDVTNIDSVGIITAQSGIDVGPTSGIGITLTSGGNITAAGNLESSYLKVVASPLQTSGGLVRIDGSTDRVIELNYDGSALFKAPTANGVEVQTVGGNEGTKFPFVGKNTSGTTTFKVNGDGKIQSGNNYTDGNGVNIFAGGSIYIRQDGATGGVLRIRNGSDYKIELKGDGSATFKNKLTVQRDSATSVDTVDIYNGTSGGDNRVKIRTLANGGGDPYLFFDGGGNNMVVGLSYAGTTSNELVMGTGNSASGVTGLKINGLGQTVIGSYTQGSEQLRVKGGEADIWLDSQASGIWRIMGSTGGSTHMFRVYDNTNSGDRLLINASGRVRLPAVPGVAGSNLANLQIESDGNLCTTTSIRAAKTNISPLADTSWLFDLNPVTFNWRTKTENEDGTLNWGEEADGCTQYGLIAEEVEEVKDDFCYYNNDGELSGVHYDRLVAPLLKVVQQQQEQIETLEAKVQALEGS